LEFGRNDSMQMRVWLRYQSDGLLVRRLIPT